MRLCSIKTIGGEQAAIQMAGGILPVGEINRLTGTTYPINLMGIIEDNAAQDIFRTAQGLSGLALLKEQNVRFAPPYRTPHKLWGIGLNYQAHAADLAVAQPEQEPGTYMRPNSCIIGMGDTIELPAMSQRVTGEAELVLIVGRQCKNLTVEEAKDAIFGYTVALDMTAEDMIRRNPRYIPKSKGFDTFCSLGPWVVTPDEVADLSQVQVCTIINSRVHASNLVANMRFDPYWLLSYISSGMTLYAGDILCTGTPGAAVIEDGDVVEALVEGIGHLCNPVHRV